MATAQPGLRRHAGAGSGTRRQADSKAVASLVLSILGILVLPVVLSALGIVFGVLSLRDTERSPSLTGRGLAVAGVVLGVIGVLGGVAIGVAFLS